MKGMCRDMFEYIKDKKDSEDNILKEIAIILLATTFLFLTILVIINDSLNPPALPKRLLREQVAIFICLSIEVTSIYISIQSIYHKKNNYSEDDCD